MDVLGVIDDYVTGRHIPEDRAACALLVGDGDCDGEIVGRFSARFRLDQFLLARRLGFGLDVARGFDPSS